MVLLLLVSAVAIARPFEWTLGGRDPGIYISGGALIAQSGSALEADPVAAEISDDAAPSFFGARGVFGFASFFAAGITISF